MTECRVCWVGPAGQLLNSTLKHLWIEYRSEEHLLIWGLEGPKLGLTAAVDFMCGFGQVTDSLENKISGMEGSESFEYRVRTKDCRGFWKWFQSGILDQRNVSLFSHCKQDLWTLKNVCLFKICAIRLVMFYACTSLHSFAHPFLHQSTLTYIGKVSFKREVFQSWWVKETCMIFHLAYSAELTQLFLEFWLQILYACTLANSLFARSRLQILCHDCPSPLPNQRLSFVSGASWLSCGSVERAGSKKRQLLHCLPQKPGICVTECYEQEK